MKVRHAVVVAALAAVVGAAMVRAGSAPAGTTFLGGTAVLGVNGLDVRYAQAGHAPGALVTHVVRYRGYAHANSWQWVPYPFGGGPGKRARWMRTIQDMSTNPGGLTEITVTAIADSDGVVHFSLNVANLQPSPLTSAVPNVGPFICDREASAVVYDTRVRPRIFYSGRQRWINPAGCGGPSAPPIP